MTLAERMLLVFEGSKVAHGTTTVGRIGRNGKADSESRIVRQPLTQKIMQGHIEGKQGIGAIPINDDNKCKWGALDIDIYDLDHKELQNTIQKLKLPLLHCRSKSGGAHLYLFIEEYEQAKVVREYLLEMAVALGHSGCEIFPKQDKILADRGDVGNFLNLPYFDADLPQRYCFNKNVESMELEEFLGTIEETRTTVGFLENMRVKKPRKHFKDGPPCLQHLFSDGATGDDRNKKMYNIGIYCIQKHPDNWKAEMETFNQALCSPPLEAKEILDLQKSLEKKKNEYFYTCEQQPFKSFCDKELCMTMKFGVGSSGPEMVESGNLQIILSEPRLYFLTVSGSRIQLSTEQLQNQQLFQRACMEQATVVPPIVPAKKWQQHLQVLMKEGVKQSVPEELTLTGQFKALLREFCTSHIRAMHPEELLQGKPWTDNQGYTSFSMSGLDEFLNLRRFNSYTRAQIQELLKQINGNKNCHGKKNITKADGSRTTIRVWWVPAFENQDVDLPIQEIEKDDIPF